MKINWDLSPITISKIHPQLRWFLLEATVANEAFLGYNLRFDGTIRIQLRWFLLEATVANEVFLGYNLRFDGTIRIQLRWLPLEAVRPLPDK